jgi:hypothetical protein
MMAVAVIGAAGAIAAGGSVPALAATTSGATYDQSVGASVYGPGDVGWCAALLLSAAASTGSPAYMSAMMENNLTDTCTTWLESSVDGGAWTDVSPQQTLPAGTGFNNFPWYKTANYYDGPGTSIRACVQPASSTTPACSPGESLPASTGVPANDATSVYYAHNNQSAGTTGCSVYLSSNSMTKSAASQVNMTLHSIQASCTGWLESSADNGTTWEQATPTYSAGLNEEWAFSSPALADGTGELARACVQGTTGAAVCTVAW